MPRKQLRFGEGLVVARRNQRGQAATSGPPDPQHWPLGAQDAQPLRAAGVHLSGDVLPRGRA